MQQVRCPLSFAFAERLQEQVVPVHEEVAVEGRGVEEAPALREAPDVAPVPLAQHVVGLAAQQRLHGHGHRLAAVLLDVEPRR